ncbi:MAG: cofactor-independent phosphoglycerate mutase [Clostridia bacterium]|nr:cofactor-independent phosphoglycerate mutase [Clostridia bacterium]
MKYIVLLCDGMADRPFEAIGNKTPMEAADKPTMDALAAKSELGLVKTVPEGLSPGSDVANLAVLGYNAADCYTGRSPLEAANIGIEMTDTDVAMRCNLVTLSDEEVYAEKTILDYCAGDIHTVEADEIIKTVQEAFGGGAFDVYTGTAYRHCLVWHDGKTDIGKLTPPHDITGRVIGDYLPSHPDAAELLAMMEKSYDLLKDHPVNRSRIERGLAPANAIWLWGHGTKPQLKNFEELYGVKGAMVSAVDLLKGIARLNGMTVCEVEGATGYIDTNFEGKRDAAIEALKNGHDLVYIHLEAPDECGHRGEAENKVRSLEEIDRRVLKPLLDELKGMDDFTLLICPDHPTPLCVKTHTSDAVPYLLYRSNAEKENGITRFTEETAASTGRFVDPGYTLMNHVLGND